MMKKTTMKFGHLDFLSLPWRLCRKLGVEMCILGRRKSFCSVGGDLQNPEQLLWLVLGIQNSHKIV